MISKFSHNNPEYGSNFNCKNNVKYPYSYNDRTTYYYEEVITWSKYNLENYWFDLLIISPSDIEMNYMNLIQLAIYKVI